MQTTPVGDERPSTLDTSAVHEGMAVLVAGPGYEGYVVVDTIVNGTSAGGVRVADDLPLDEVRELAREMSLKYALFHLPRGGAKSGLRMSRDLSPDARQEALTDFGRKLAPIIRNGIYYPGMDMNCGPEELRAIYRGAGSELGAITDTSWFTAISVLHALKSCVATLNLEKRPVTLAVEGFGSVARHLADRLDPKEFRVAAVATIEGGVLGQEPFDPSDLSRRKVEQGDAFVRDLPGKEIDRNEVLTADVDVLLPSSRTWVVTPALARDVRAKGIVPISNAPYAGNAVDILSERGILTLPGYLANVGGVLASSLFDQGVAKPHIEELFAKEYRSIVDGILRISTRRGKPATEIAEALAREHMSKRVPFPRRSLIERLHARFLRPKLPTGIRGRLAHRAFTERFALVSEEIAELERQA